MKDMKEMLEKEGIQEAMDPDLKRAFEFADNKIDDSIKDPGAFKMRKDMIKVSGDGTFYTLQGEGPTMGLPCTFLRLQFCNLKCDWCDAWYTWNPNTEEFWTEWRDWTFQHCAEVIHNTWEGPDIPRRLIISGGEPLVQQKQFAEVLKILTDPLGPYQKCISNPNKDRRLWSPALDLRYSMYNVEWETNGTLMPDPFWCAAQYNCSPKLDNSGNAFHARVKPKILAKLNTLNTTFKFVCMTEDDLREIELDFLPHIDVNKVIIMPQGVTEEEVSANAKVLAEPCKERGWRLMPRLQNICWDGARRRV